MADLFLDMMTFAVVAAASFLGVSGVTTMLNVRRRLSSETGVSAFSSPPAASPLLQREGVRNSFLAWVESSSSLNDSADRARLRKTLIGAGFEHSAAPVWYVIIRFGLAITLPLAFILFQALSPMPITGFLLTFWSLCLCALGLTGPRLFVDNRRRARALQLEQEFPDALDLMVVCVEAGLGLEAALVRVGQEATASHPRVAGELKKVTQELSAGRGRPDALRAMADRAEVDSVKSFVALVIQTDALGTSIAQTLKTFAHEMRQARYFKAEEKALRIPVLLTVPLIVCILPVIVTALLLPPIIDVLRQVVPSLTHHH